MKTSQDGIDLIKRFEGLELEAYQDIAGIWTIGYGHIETARPGMRISEAEAETLLQRDLKPREQAVGRLVSVDLNQNEFDALVSFVYNVGVNAFRRSTARRRLNSGDRIGAADALTWWNKATVGGVLREVTGLTRRRAAERALFLTPANPPIVAGGRQHDENSRTTPMEDPPRRGSLAGSRTVQGATVAGGAGAAASNMGRESAVELETIEANGGGAPANDVLPEPQPDAPPANDPITDGATADDATNEGPADESATDESAAAENATGESPSGDGAQSAREGVAAPEPAPTIDSGVVQSQIQFALLILIIAAAAYIIFARIDDWWNYRR